MAVLFLDSAHGQDGASRWVEFTLSSVVTDSPSGRNAYRFATSSAHVAAWSYPTPADSALVGWYGRISSLDNDNSAQVLLFRIIGPTAVHLTLGFNSAGALTVRRGGGTAALIASSAPNVVSLNSWHHFEFRAEIHDTNGRVEIWVDGVKRVDFTGNTRNTGSDTTVGSIRFGRVFVGDWDISDVRIGDGTTPLGVTQVWHHLPDGDGNNTDLTPEPTADNFTRVNEATPDGDTTYVHSDTEGDYDLYTYEDLPSGDWDVLAVQTVLNGRVEEGGAKALRPVIRSGSSEAQGIGQALANNYSSHMEVFETNPVTTDPWDQAEVNSIEFGPEVRDV